MKNGFETTGYAGTDAERQLNAKLAHNPLLDANPSALIEYFEAYAKKMRIHPALLEKGVDFARCVLNVFSGAFENNHPDGSEFIGSDSWIRKITYTDIFSPTVILSLWEMPGNIRNYWLTSYLATLAKPHAGDYLAALNSDEHRLTLEWVRVVFNHLQKHARDALYAFDVDGEIPPLLLPSSVECTIDAKTTTCLADAILSLSQSIENIAQQLSSPQNSRLKMLCEGLILEDDHSQKARAAAVMSEFLVKLVNEYQIKGSEDKS